MIIYECLCEKGHKENHHPFKNSTTIIMRLCKSCHVKEHKRLNSFLGIPNLEGTHINKEDSDLINMDVIHGRLNELEWSQSMFAEKLGKSRQSVSQLFDRIRYGKVTLTTLNKIAGILNMDGMELLK